MLCSAFGQRFLHQSVYHASSLTTFTFRVEEFNFYLLQKVVDYLRSLQFLVKLAGRVRLIEKSFVRSGVTFSIKTCLRSS